MNYKPNVWNQLKNMGPKDLMNALEKDGAVPDISRGAILVYRYPNGKRVTIHFHPGKSYPRGTLQGLLDDIGWTEKDLRRLKLIK